MQLINNAIADITAAKEKILNELIEKIEGRPVILRDVENLIIATRPSHFNTILERVIYRDIELVDIEVDMVAMTVQFIPNYVND